MTITFKIDIDLDLYPAPVVISGPESYDLHGRGYVLVEEDDCTYRSFEIRYDVHCSPFKQAAITGHLLAEGFEEYFYLFDTLAGKTVARVYMDGYFGHFYEADNLFYVADAGSLYCINYNGNIVWRSANLGIDGVIVNDIEVDKIYGSGEWDPPGGWRDFVLDKHTGALLTEL